MGKIVRHEEYSKYMPDGFEVRSVAPYDTQFYLVDLRTQAAVTSRTKAQVDSWLIKERRPQIFASVLRFALRIREQEKRDLIAKKKKQQQKEG